ncbi:conserved hypothetical protein [Candidatus Sulfotelmatobacter sp. SbA7]|nr:conserved hypothetical protein [Candidatus Sulfotelmatobacter sp. SbA7]
MKDGIDGRPDSEAVDRTGVLTHLAVELGRKDALACVGAWFETLDQKGVPGKLAIMLDYYRANAIAGERYGTEWKWEQPTLAREIFSLRRAVNHLEFRQLSVRDRCMCLNNLGNRLRVAGRAIEALAYWSRTLEVEPNFGMAHCNKARILLGYADVLEDREQRTIFYWMAHKEASAALANTALYTHVRDRATVESAKEQKKWIESFLDVDAITKLDPLASEDTAATDEEREYRRWCRENCLYLNLLNDLGPYPVAEWDTIALPVHMVPDDAPYIFDSFFDQMKQEYVSARWLLYEGLTAKIPHFSDRDVFLAAIEPRPALCLAIEKAKTAYRTFYSLFDKVAFFMNEYMALGINESDVSFGRLWREHKDKPIRPQFDLTGNWGFCALYWLAKDFFEKENDEVAEPQARSLKDIRNQIEHKYLRVTATEPPSAPAVGDLAWMVSRRQFGDKAIHLMKCARSALIYLAIGVRFEELRREPNLADPPVEPISPARWLTDSEKV